MLTVLTQACWGLNTLALDTLNQTWSFTLHAAPSLPQVLWFPNTHPHIELFHDWGLTAQWLQGGQALPRLASVALYSGYDNTLDVFLPIDRFVINRMLAGVQWTGASLDRSIRFQGYPWHYFGPFSGGAGRGYPTLNGLALTRYPLPWELGLLTSVLTHRDVGRSLLLLSTRGHLGGLLNFPNIFLDGTNQRVLARYFMEKGPKVGSFGFLKKDIRLHN